MCARGCPWFLCAARCGGPQRRRTGYSRGATLGCPARGLASRICRVFPTPAQHRACLPCPAVPLARVQVHPRGHRSERGRHGQVHPGWALCCAVTAPCAARVATYSARLWVLATVLRPCRDCQPMCGLPGEFQAAAASTRPRAMARLPCRLQVLWPEPRRARGQDGDLVPRVGAWRQGAVPLRAGCRRHAWRGGALLLVAASRSVRRPRACFGCKLRLHATGLSTSGARTVAGPSCDRGCASSPSQFCILCLSCRAPLLLLPLGCLAGAGSDR